MDPRTAAKNLCIVALLVLQFAAVQLSGDSSASATPAAGTTPMVCPVDTVDIARADVSAIETLAGQTAKSAAKVVALRATGELASLVGLRQLTLNDRRFLRLITDPRTCFAGQPGTDLLPAAACSATEIRINTARVSSLAKLIGWKNARPLVNARPFLTPDDIKAIPETGAKLLGRLARKGGTCLDPVANLSTSFGEGRVEIGVDIEPGRYVAIDVIGCFWERSRGLTDAPVHVNARGLRDTAHQVIVDIPHTDRTFFSSGCGTWTRVDIAGLAALAETPGDGDYLVTTQLQPGTYRATSADDCTWTRVNRLSGNDADIIKTAQLPSTHSLVNLLPTDVAFRSQGCGSWVFVPPGCLNQLQAVYPAEPAEFPHVYGVSDSVLLSTQYEIGLAFEDFTVNWGGFGGLNVPSALEIVDIEVGEAKVTGSTVIVGLGHNYRGEMEPDYPGFIDALIGAFPDHVDRVIWVAPSRFNTSMPIVVGHLNDALARWPQLEIADFWVEADAQNHPEWYNDGLHLDVEGRLIMADYLLDKVLNPCG